MKRLLVILGTMAVLGLAAGCDERSDLSEAAAVVAGKADGRMGRRINHNETLLRDENACATALELAVPRIFRR